LVETKSEPKLKLRRSRSRKKEPPIHEQATPPPIWTEVVQRASATLHTTTICSYIARLQVWIERDLGGGVVFVLERGQRKSFREGIRHCFFGGQIVHDKYLKE
jgi:hypothetical protein